LIWEDGIGMIGIGNCASPTTSWILISRILKYAYRLATAPLRTLPDFLIIGAQRCGTTSLYNYLVASSNILPAFRKEVHFFDKRFGRGILWYRAYFPSRLTKLCIARSQQDGFIVGEATPYYLFHPHAARRVWHAAPWAKLIVLVRNPIYRAFSHYQYEVRLGVETLSFREAIDREEERLDGEIERMLSDESYVSFNHQHFSYLSRGIYVEQIERWRALFPRQQILILKSEELFTQTEDVVQQVAKFLGASYCELRDTRTYNEGQYPDMDPSLREHLSLYFRPYNEALQAYLNADLGWE
jgi:hypothetical protein